MAHKISEGSRLASADAPLVVAQRLALHSTPTLTANAYSVIGSPALQKAVEQLPSFQSPKPADDDDDQDEVE